MIPKTYYAYNRICMEKMDSCRAYSRLSAAKFFAKKKQISLKDWLEIFIAYEYADYNKIYGKNISFLRKGIIVVQYRVLRYGQHVVRQFNDSGMALPKVITKSNFIGFMKEMKDIGWKMIIEENKKTS